MLISDFKNKGYKCNRIAEMNIFTNVNKMDMSFDSIIEHIMCAPVCKLNAMINKNKFLKINSNEIGVIN